MDWTDMVLIHRKDKEIALFLKTGDFSFLERIVDVEVHKKGEDMPLIKSKSKKAIGKNIKEMEESGHSKAQSVAAALDTARRAGAKIPKPKKK